MLAPTVQLKDECLETGRGIMEKAPSPKGQGTDAGQNHKRNATCAFGVCMMLAPAQLGGVVAEAGVLSKKLTECDRKDLGLDGNHFCPKRPSKGMESHLLGQLAKSALEHKVCFDCLGSDRDGTAWSRQEPHLEKLAALHSTPGDVKKVVHKLCIGHELVNFEKELVKQVQNTSKMVRRSLCAEDVGGTCASGVLKTGLKGKRKRRNKQRELVHLQGNQEGRNPRLLRNPHARELQNRRRHPQDEVGGGGKV